MNLAGVSPVGKKHTLDIKELPELSHNLYSWSRSLIFFILESDEMLAIVANTSRHCPKCFIWQHLI